MDNNRHLSIFHLMHCMQILMASILPFLLVLIMPWQIASYSCSVSGQTSLTLGGSATICVHIVSRNVNQTVLTYAFKTTVDTFSALKINGLYQILSNSSVPIYAVIQAAQNNSVATQMLLSDKTANKHRLVLSFVVTLENGNVVNIVDDNTDCSTCQTSDGSQVCDTQANKCYDTSLISDTVQPRFFTSWVGTDSANNYMLSHTKRLSRFTQYSIGNLYQGLINQFK